MNIEYGGVGIGQPEMLAAIIPIALAFFLYLRRPHMNKKRWTFLLSRSFLALLLIAALSRPYIVAELEKFQDTASVTILADRSASMELYGKDGASLAEKLYSGIRAGMKNSTGFESVNIKDYSKGDRTEIGNALYQNSAEFSKETNLLILVSDGNNNYGRNAVDVAKFVGETGAKIFSLTPEQESDEIYILGIDGEKKIPANVEYPFTVDVGKLGKLGIYHLTVSVDGKEILSKEMQQSQDVNPVNLTHSFKEQGIHIITAEIAPKTPDFLSANNRFMKVVDVVDKPRVLVITDQKTYSPLIQVLNRNYEVVLDPNHGSSKDYSTYAAVFLDNQNASVLSEDTISALRQYVIDGGGLVVVGGDTAYEKGAYKDKASLEALLPVRSVEQPEKKRKEIAVVLVIDISQSTAYGLEGESKINLEKALALNIVKQLDPKDYVGVVAFNVGAFAVSGMGRLEDNQFEIEDKIPRLAFGGGTDMLPGIEMADQFLEGYSCDKYVIILSDGVLGVRSTAREDTTLQKIKSMGDNGVTIYSVGVGFDTNEAFMSKIASVGRGIYFKPESLERLKMEFEEKEEEKDKERYTLSIYNRYHFITENLELPETTIGNYNDVTPKSISQVLVTTESKKPIVTVWRFGLGRVVSITTDDGLAWSPNFYSSSGGRLVASITNWAIGDLEKKKAVRIETVDVSVGGEAAALIRASAPPRLTVQKEGASSEDLPVKQVDREIYSARFTPQDTGIYLLAAANPSGEDADAVAVNYPVEYARLGANTEELAAITSATGGKSYNASQIKELREDAIEYIRQGSMKKVEDRKPLEAYFAAAALFLFFVDVVIRRIKEIRRLRGR